MAGQQTYAPDSVFAPVHGYPLLVALSFDTPAQQYRVLNVTQSELILSQLVENVGRQGIFALADESPDLRDPVICHRRGIRAWMRWEAAKTPSQNHTSRPLASQIDLRSIQKTHDGYPRSSQCGNLLDNDERRV